MANMLQKGAAWLAGKLKAHAGETVTYSRGAQSVTLTGTFGQTKLSLSDGLGGNRIEWTDADLIVAAADLVLGGAAAEPQRGDRVVRVTGGKTVTYEVRPYDRDEPCWRWADESRTLMRVHMKEVAVA